MKQHVLLFICLLSLLSCEKKNETLPDNQTGTDPQETSGIGILREGGESSDCGQLRTQTPGGWGVQCHGNNPGAYLYANFTKAFPFGLSVGCTPGFSVKLTRVSAVTCFLPSGGKAQVLTRNYTNPSGLKNVLAGHLVALTLSVGFDAYDVNFGKAGIELGAMKIKSGAFAEWKVSDFLAVASQVLGGCNKEFAIEQVLETASKINENYVDGTSDNGYLVCPIL